MGRSLRSLILEKAMSWLGSDESIGGKPKIRKAKTALSILVAMHYDYMYVNEHRWFDYELKTTEDIPLQDRVPVSTAAFALHIDKIPMLSEWPLDRMLFYIRDF